MSKAFKCDRCGDLYEPYEAIPNQFYITQRSFNATAWDLCENCSQELQKWMKKELGCKWQMCNHCAKRFDCDDNAAIEYRKEHEE